MPRAPSTVRRKTVAFSGHGRAEPGREGLGRRGANPSGGAEQGSRDRFEAGVGHPARRGDEHRGMHRLAPEPARRLGGVAQIHQRHREALPDEPRGPGIADHARADLAGAEGLHQPPLAVARQHDALGPDARVHEQGAQCLGLGGAGGREADGFPLEIGEVANLGAAGGRHEEGDGRRHGEPEDQPRRSALGMPDAKGGVEREGRQVQLPRSQLGGRLGGASEGLERDPDVLLGEVPGRLRDPDRQVLRGGCGAPHAEAEGGLKEHGEAEHGLPLRRPPTRGSGARVARRRRAPRGCAPARPSAPGPAGRPGGL